MAEQNESIKITGAVRKQLFGEDGVLKYDHTDHNLIVTAGKTYLATWLAAASQAGEFMSYIALGTGSSGPTSGDTALGSEFSGGGYSRQIGTLTSSTNTWQSVATFGAGNGTGAITEAGLFDISSVGNMFARQVFSVITKGAGDTLVLTWQVSFS